MGEMLFCFHLNILSLNNDLMMLMMMMLMVMMAMSWLVYTIWSIWIFWFWNCSAARWPACRQCERLGSARKLNYNWVSPVYQSINISWVVMTGSSIQLGYRCRTHQAINIMLSFVTGFIFVLKWDSARG